MYFVLLKVLHHQTYRQTRNNKILIHLLTSQHVYIFCKDINCVNTSKIIMKELSGESFWMQILVEVELFFFQTGSVALDFYFIYFFLVASSLFGFTEFKQPLDDGTPMLRLVCDLISQIFCDNVGVTLDATLAAIKRFVIYLCR